MFKYEQQFEQTISVTPDILFFAFRYALGRRTFAPSIVAKEIKHNIKVLPRSGMGIHQNKQLNALDYYGGSQ